MLQSAKQLLAKTYNFLDKKFSNSPYGCLDSPGPQEIRPGTFNVFSGWAFDQKGSHIAGIEVFQEQKKLGVCDYGLERDDVRKNFPAFPQAQKSGFFGWIFIPRKPDTQIKIYSINNKGDKNVLCTLKPSWRSRVSCFLNKTLQLKKTKPARPSKRSCRPADIPLKILIAGMAKTGTTALFFKISNSLAAHEDIASKTKLLFEPFSYSGSKNERVMAKIILAAKTPLSIWGETARSHLVNYDDFSTFNKKILLVRDPRDRLISTLLYSSQGKIFRSNPHNFETLLGLLQKKEQDPGSVSVQELILARLRATNRTLQEWKKCLAINYTYFLEFTHRKNDFFSYHYEDFVLEKTDGLENFLGFPLTGAAAVEKSLERVVRTKNSGDWKNWFLEEDIQFFKPIFSEFMRELGYEDCWSLPDRQVILPAHASEYVKKNMPHNTVG